MRARAQDVALAVDVGGTKIAAALVDLDGQVLDVAEVPTPVGGGAEAVADALSAAVHTILDGPQGARVDRVGISSAGPVDASAGTVSPVNIADWREFPLVDRVSALVPGAPVVLAGDGVTLAAAEHAFGAARPYDDVLCMTVSTGVGGGLVIGGRVHAGPSGNAGHIGHTVVDLDGPLCPCGARGCVEAFAGGAAMVRWATGEGWAPRAGQPATAAGLAAAARLGDRIATAAFDRATRALAAAIASTAMLVDVQAVVIGGGVADAGEVLFAPLQSHLDSSARLPFASDVTVVRAALGRTACLVGAAHVAFASAGEPGYRKAVSS